jgi:hypothetical protein
MLHWILIHHLFFWLTHLLLHQCGMAVVVVVPTLAQMGCV